MFELVGLAVSVAAVLGAHHTTRGFVRARLRYVDAVLSARAPWVAAAAAAVLAIPVCALLPLPFVGIGTGLLIAAGVGTGVRAGARDINSATRYLSGS
jgi:hypothetical protein